MGKKSKKTSTTTTPTTTTTTTEGNVFDPFEKLDDSQLDVFKQFKDRLAKLEPELDEPERKWIENDRDMMILRYLRARDYEIDAAFELLKGTIQWRKTYKPYETSAEALSYEACTGKQYVYGKSNGRSVIYMRPARENTKNHENQIRLLVYNIERAISLMDKSQGHEQICLLIDFQGYSLLNAPPMSVSKLTLEILGNHYPERLGNAFLIDPPFIFNIFWGAISPFVNKVTAKKVVFVSGEKGKQKIYNSYFTSAAEVEKSVGGESEHEYHHPHFWRKEVEMNRIERGLDPISEEEMERVLNLKE
ncbi:hypothetical protein CYY_002477 [Polysphondylium violaceum]|uniref:CRAL-TRIO domain-containing protein n=1 Tax=Polysphondylium violaceum TaxID=133409 RepID=A0A8J4PYE3_9MYCE|nr:hypothetical protein CYY_002477 [Polysphondylium violaceum]